MPGGRLTRQELGWLLAQEARGAAKALREGLSGPVSMPAPTVHVEINEGSSPSMPPQQLTSSLDALDGAINLLSELEGGSAGKGRRGRIDIAALFYEIAPAARIAIEPGAGTEVFGEESELRRMFHVLISQTQAIGAGTDAPELRICRQDEWVKIIVDLGPDTSAHGEIERRWLSRMAVRHGGRFELEAGTQSISLPADASTDQNEVAELRRELDQAQQLGEAYARELAAAFAPSTEPTTVDAGHHGVEASTTQLEVMIGLSAAVARVLRPLCEGLRKDIVTAKNSRVPRELEEAMSRRASRTHELLGELARVAGCDPREPSAATDCSVLLRDTIAEADGRASRHGVTLSLHAPATLTHSVPRRVFALMLRSLVDHGIAATPQGGEVTVRASSTNQTIELQVEDGGPVVPGNAIGELLSSQGDPSSIGRPAGAPLQVALATAQFLGGSASAGESDTGRFVVRLSFPVRP